MIRNMLFGLGLIVVLFLICVCVGGAIGGWLFGLIGLHGLGKFLGVIGGGVGSFYIVKWLRSVGPGN